MGDKREEMKECELCDRPAQMYCESDQASLCCGCDGKVHGANFLVARHSRNLLCHVCQSLTPWHASGARLGTTVSVCESCVGRSDRALQQQEEGSGDNEHEVGDADAEDNDYNDEMDGDDEDDFDDDEDEEEWEEDGENQVVPWSSTPPPVPSSSSSEDSTSRLAGGSTEAALPSKRRRENADLLFLNDVDCAADEEATSLASFRATKDRKKELILSSDSRSAVIESVLKFQLEKGSRDNGVLDICKLRMVGLSVGEKHFIQGGIAQDLRTDGRKRLHHRPISVETGVIPQSNGSARVRLGATEVIVSVKAELGKPSPFQLDKGKVAIFVDCSPTAGPMFEGRGGEGLSTELSVSLQRCLLGGKSGEGAGIDLSSLMVVEGKLCWDLYIDGLVVSSDGNLLDALGAAIKAALSNTGIPKVNVTQDASDADPEVDISDEEFLQFDTSGVPVIVTLTKVGRHYIVDATTEEESHMSSAVSVSVNRHGNVCGLTKRRGAGLDPSVILDMISVSKHVSQQLITVLDSEIFAAEASAADN